MSRDPEILRTQTHEPQDRLKKLATELLAMPVTDDTFFKDKLDIGAGLRPIYKDDNKLANAARTQFGQADFLIALLNCWMPSIRSPSPELLTLKCRFSLMTLLNRLTIRDVLQQKPEIMAGLQYGSHNSMAQGKQVTQNAADYVNALYDEATPSGNASHQEDTRSAGTSLYYIGKEELKNLEAIEAKFCELLAALPPRRQRG
jgi:hypothetical protein